jgi:hypothetical protein
VSAGDITATWRDKAACAAAIKETPSLLGAWDGRDTEEDPHPFAENAKKICLGCKVRNMCLQDALNDEEAQGIRGGYDFDAGKLPVAVAREIRDTMGLVIGEHQSTGRPKS